MPVGTSGWSWSKAPENSLQTACAGTVGVAGFWTLQVVWVVHLESLAGLYRCNRGWYWIWVHGSLPLRSCKVLR